MYANFVSGFWLLILIALFSLNDLNDANASKKSVIGLVSNINIHTYIDGEYLNGG